MKKIRLLTVLGVRINIHWTFLLLIAWILIIQAVSRASMEQTIWALVAITSIFACVVLHELGHALAASYYHIRTRDITLYPIGGIATMEKLPAKPPEEIIISLAGPLVNLVIAAVLLPFIPDYVPFWKTAGVIDNVQAGNFVLYLHSINMILALFNLIPAFPMDGGRVLRGILGLFLHDDSPTYIAVLTGRIIATLFILIGLFSFSLILPVIGLLIVFADAGEEQLVYLRTAVKGIRLKELAVRDYATLQDDLTIQEVAGEWLPARYQYFAITGKHGLVGVITRSVLLQALAAGRYNEAIGTLVSKSPEILEGERTGDSIIDKLLLQNNAVYPVLSDNQLAGVLSLDSIIEYLLIHDTQKKSQGHRASVTRLLHQA